MQAVDPQAQHIAATFYEENVSKDRALAPPTACDTSRPESPPKIARWGSSRLRRRDDREEHPAAHQANLETNASAQAQLIAEADQLRIRAIELQTEPAAADEQAAAPAFERGARRRRHRRHLHRRRCRARRRHGAGSRRRQHQGANEDQERATGVPARCAGCGRAGRRHHRGGHRHDGPCQSAEFSGRFRCSTRLRSTPSSSGSSRRRTMNGQAVPVVMTVTVNFTLGG